MDSFPQELIDEIIDNVPESSLRSCSLVARRWRRKCQQHIFHIIKFSSEDEVNRWWTDIPQDSDGVVSYVRSVQFSKIYYWGDPALPRRVLKNLSSLRELVIEKTDIPDELLDHISCGEFGKGITTLYLRFPPCTHATMASMILSLPNLKELRVDDNGDMSEEPLPAPSVTLQRRKLDSLYLYGDANGMAEVLAKYRFTVSYLYMRLHISGAAQFLTVSSETVVELYFCDTLDGAIPPPVPIPSLPALTTLNIVLLARIPSPRLTNILCSIGSAPALTSVAFGYRHWSSVQIPPLAGPWADVDGWLSRIVKHTRVRGSLSLTLRPWLKGKSVWEGFLPEFRACGGEIETSP